MKMRISYKNTKKMPRNKIRRSMNKNKSPQKSLTSSSIGILIVFLVAMAFSFTDLIFTKSSNTPYQETEIVQ